MFYTHQGTFLNFDEIEFAQVGKDSAIVYMTNGAKHSFLSGAEELIVQIEALDTVRVGSKVFLRRNISTIKHTATMATLETISGYRETVTGEERVANLLNDATLPPASEDPQLECVSSPQQYKVMAETEAPKGRPRRAARAR